MLTNDARFRNARLSVRQPGLLYLLKTKPVTPWQGGKYNRQRGKRANDMATKLQAAWPQATFEFKGWVGPGPGFPYGGPTAALYVLYAWSGGLPTPEPECASCKAPTAHPYTVSCYQCGTALCIPCSRSTTELGSFCLRCLHYLH